MQNPVNTRCWLCKMQHKPGGAFLTDKLQVISQHGQAARSPGHGICHCSHLSPCPLPAPHSVLGDGSLPVPPCWVPCSSARAPQWRPGHDTVLYKCHRTGMEGRSTYTDITPRGALAMGLAPLWCGTPFPKPHEHRTDPRRKVPQPPASSPPGAPVSRPEAVAQAQEKSCWGK